jgi:uncharacterized protein YwqG
MLPNPHRHLELPPLHPVLEPFRPALEQSAKPAWLLKCHTIPSVSRYHTHIAGTTPFVPQYLDWPTCSQCAQPLEFIWQVNFADFGGIGSFADQGLFQFFYCWQCFPLSSEGPGWACRWFADFDPLQAEDIPQALCPYAHEFGTVDRLGPYAVEIVPFLSFPAKFSNENPIPFDMQNEMVSKEDGCLWAVYSFTKGLYLEDQMLSRIGGYPPWVQFQEETLDCPTCGQRAEFVGAIGSDDTNLVWGDSGYWYFFACKATPACQGLSKPLMASQCY